MSEREPEGTDGVSDRVGELADALLGNPVVNQALGAAFGARNRVAGAQRVAMGALDIPSKSELERSERRMRSLADRVEALEDELDRVQDDLRYLRDQLNPDEES